MSSQLVETRAYEMNRVEVRGQGSNIHFRGHAAVFNSGSLPIGPTGFREVVKPHAFKRALSEGQDVLFTINHDPDKLLARTSSGTLKLNEDNIGLAVEATLPDTSYARDMAELVGRGDMNAMSFVFVPKKQSWGESAEGRTRELHDVDLRDVSVVAKPAYPATSNIDIEQREIWDALTLAVTESREGKAISASNKEIIANAIAALKVLIADEEAEDDSTNPRMLKLALMEKFGS